MHIALYSILALVILIQWAVLHRRKKFPMLEKITCVGYKCLIKHDCSKTWCAYTSPDGKFKGNLKQCYVRYLFEKKLKEFSLEEPVAKVPSAGVLWEEEKTVLTPENPRN